MLGEINVNILKILQKNARIPNVDIARQVYMAPSTVLERIRKLEQKGFVDGYEVRLNPEKFKRNLVAFISIISSTRKAVLLTGNELMAIPEIQDIHHITSDNGLLAKAPVSDVGELGTLIQNKILKITGENKHIRLLPCLPSRKQDEIR